jgi:hypothetical protein
LSGDDTAFYTPANRALIQEILDPKTKAADQKADLIKLGQASQALQNELQSLIKGHTNKTFLTITCGAAAKDDSSSTSGSSTSSSSDSNGT